EAIAERHLGTPPEDVGGAADVDHAAALLARLRRAVPHLGPAAGDLEQRARELIHVGLDPRANVHRSRGIALQREQAHACDITHEHVVPGLLAVAGEGAGLAAQHPAAEDPHPPRLAVRILARSVHVGVAERDERHAVLREVEVTVQLPRALADAVRADRPGRVRLGCRERLLLAVYRAAGRNEEHLLYSRLARRFA